MQQIASMFAKLGFKVDTSGLDLFKEKLREARGDTALFARNAKMLKNNLNEVNKAVLSVNSNLKLRKTDSKLSDSYVALKNAVMASDKALVSITKNQPTTTKSLGKIHASVLVGTGFWEKYANQVQKTRDLLKQANQEMASLRKNSTVSVKVNQFQPRQTTTRTQPRQSSQQPQTTPFGGREDCIGGGR